MLARLISRLYGPGFSTVRNAFLVSFLMWVVLRPQLAGNFTIIHYLLLFSVWYAIISIVNRNKRRSSGQ